MGGGSSQIRPSRAPDLVSPLGAAWRYTAIAEDHPSIAAWLVNRPEVHPLWQWWLVTAISLRPHPDFPSAELRYAGAEFEVQIISLNPGKPLPNPDDPTGSRFYPLIPVDFCEQYHGISNQQIAYIVGAMAAEIVSGLESPDSDHRRCWAQKVGGWVTHYREHVH